MKDELEHIRESLLDIDAYIASDDKNKAWAKLHEIITYINDLLAKSARD